MKTIGTLIATAFVLLPWCITPVFSQQPAPATAGEKKIIITKRTTDADGTETTETIVKKGQAAENFDVEAYIKENRAENVELDVRVMDAGSTEGDQRVVIKHRNRQDMGWMQDVEDHVNQAIASISCSDNRAFLGVEEDSDEEPDQPGITVQVIRGSAADKAGLRSNDVVLKLNGVAVNEWDDLSGIIADAKPGETIQVEYSRNGKPGAVQAQLAKRSELDYDHESNKQGFLGITDQGPDGADDDDAPAGVRIGIVKASAADKAGLRNGDVVLLLDETPIRDWEDITDFMAYTQPDQKVQVTYRRDGQQNSVETILGAQKSMNWDFKWTPADIDVDIKVREKEACLGVYTSAYGEGGSKGARVSEFTEESAAREASMLAGDVITAVNGVRVQGHDELWAEIAKYKPGEKVQVEFLRDEQPRQIEAALKDCRDNASRVTVFDTDELGENMQREFFTWNWKEEDRNRLRERRVITIHRGTEGDSPTVNAAPGNTANPPDRRLELEGFRAYPNPSQGQVTVEFRSAPRPTIVSLLDMAGRQLFREELNAFGGDYYQQFDLTEYAKGTVIIHVQQDDKVFTEQLVVN
ncbi:MAG: PDZ domain-containing protein [Saprospirales bacterium]|nr:PDZ domain-containing protein [Saprospirales bacterium]